MRVGEIMTKDVRKDVQTISPADTIQAAATVMDDLNVGALPVCNNDELCGVITDRDITVRATAVPLVNRSKRLVGVLSLGDLATKGGDQSASEALEKASSPARPDRCQRGKRQAS